MFGLNCRYCCYIISASLTSANFSVVTPAQLQCLCSGKEKPGKELWKGLEMQLNSLYCKQLAQEGVGNKAIRTYI